MKTAGIAAMMLFAFALATVARAAEPKTSEPATGTAPAAADKPKAAEELVQISDMMKKAGELLKKLETGQVTQDEQKKIVTQLDEIIARIPPQQGGSGQSKPDQSPPQNSQPKNRSGGQSSGKGGSNPANESNIPRQVNVNPNDPKANDQAKWGALPPGQREALNQIINENFLPQKYKNLIYLYWQKISETP